VHSDVPGVRAVAQQLDSQNASPRKAGSGRGALIINADDWGRDRQTTDEIFQCIRRGTVSSTSAMVFMEDSERAADLARERNIDAGLHLNFTTVFASSRCSSVVAKHQARIVSFLTRNRWAQVIFHPGLRGAFRAVVDAQLEEFQRLFGHEPNRVDGHHHMHLCANVLRENLLPAGTVARRNFTFAPGEKSRVNIWYRQTIDKKLAKRHRLTDMLFSLPPLAPSSRVDRVLSLSESHVVELETHPVNADEKAFLFGPAMLERAERDAIARGFVF
jgi:hypothetical protein